MAVSEKFVQGRKKKMVVRIFFIIEIISVNEKLFNLQAMFTVLVFSAACAAFLASMHQESKEPALGWKNERVTILQGLFFTT